MTVREKLRVRSRPFLEADEEPRHVFFGWRGDRTLLYCILIGVTGGFLGSFDPAIALAIGLPIVLVLSYFVARYLIVVVTDRSVVLLRAVPLTATRPKALATRVPRDTRLGPVSGLNAKVQVGPQRIWVGRRFFKDIQAADAEIGLDSPPPVPTK